MGFLAGAVWGFVPGILKARLGVNEILSTVMMNAIALQLMNLLLRGPLMDPAGVTAGTFLAQSERLPEQVWLPRLVPQTLLHAGAIIAVVLAVVVYIFLWRTTIGYRIRAVGLNPDASRYAGITVPFYQALSLTLAGGFAGLAGVVEVIGVQHRLLEGITSGYGFSGIVAALFGGLHPLGADPGLVAVRQPAGGRGQDAAGRAGAVGADRHAAGAGRAVRRRLAALLVAALGSRERRGARAAAAGGPTTRGGASMNEIFSPLLSSSASSPRPSAWRRPTCMPPSARRSRRPPGVVNLGVDGIMLVGAYAAFFVVLHTGNLVAGPAGRASSSGC